MSTAQIYQLATTERKQQNRFRELRSLATTGGAEISLDGDRKLINFASNDYLGLTKHHELKKRAIEFTEKYGVGLGSSRLVSGNLNVFEKLERKVAQFKGSKTALLLPSGYQTNATVLAALGRKRTLLASDHENHNSITTGIQLTQGEWQRYSHNDLGHLETLLRKSPDSTKWIVSESVFSMDGDVSDVSALSHLATKYDAAVYIDEAHATGVLGAEGRGLCYDANGVDIAMGTFSKAFGSFGAYIACSNEMRHYLINFCAGLIYSTALPPPLLGAIDAALDLIPSMNEERARLLDKSETLRDQLNKLGFSTGNSKTQIIPIIVGTDAEALSLARYLEECAILAPAIRPPTVRDGEARVRVSLTAVHTDDHIEHLLSSLKRWKASG
ncbi:MAG: 8-amino-7-oxononanoate synthase [Cyanobacteria bacterium SZAS-4]|nr:8-amino-7-oxononanoate synthase [Cyanobacteria bacterium SZAS-4]